MSRISVQEIEFDSCLDQKKVEWLITTLPATYGVLNEMAPWRKGKWPTRVHCMTDQRIVEGRKRGAGHGYTYTQGRDKNSIWLNPHLSQWGYWLVFTHENLHHAFDDASEGELNCVLLPDVFSKVFRKRWPGHDWARSHGVGSRTPDFGDRSFCR